VYDPVTLRLSAELIETIYATFMNMMKRGLIRVKKETERGIMTLKETKAQIENENHTLYF